MYQKKQDILYLRRNKKNDVSSTLRVAIFIINIKFNQLIRICKKMLVLINIKFQDEVQALLLLSSLFDNWSKIITTVAYSSVSTKLTFRRNKRFKFLVRIFIGEMLENEWILFFSMKSRGRKPKREQDSSHFQTKIIKTRTANILLTKIAKRTVTSKIRILLYLLR